MFKQIGVLIKEEKSRQEFIRNLREILDDQPEYDVARITSKLTKFKDSSMGNLDIIYALLYAALYYSEIADVEFEEFSNEVLSLKDELFK